MPLNKLSPQNRLHQIDIPIYAITGGIGSGKSTFCKLLEEKKLPVIYADKLIKLAYEKEELKSFISKHVPGGLVKDVYDFAIIRERFLKNKNFQQSLEKNLYSFLPELFQSELRRLGSNNFVFYEIPLVFEKQLTAFFDAIICVNASQKTRIKRVMQRDQVDSEQAQAMIDIQFSLKEKVKKSHFVIENSENDLALLSQRVQDLLAYLQIV